jgi:hypothetical protein
MLKPLQIISGKQADKSLNKEQRRFNKLVQKISALRVNIAQAKELDLELRQLGEKLIKPLEAALYQAHRTWIFSLHLHPGKSKLPKKLVGKFDQVMVDEITQILSTNLSDGDQELHDLFTYYDSESRSFADFRAINDAYEKEMTAEMMFSMFGIDIEPEDLDNPEAFREKIHAQQTASKEAEQASAEAKATRKKSTVETAAEEKRRAAQAAVSKTAKQIYLDLVRHFHPDKEQDDEKRTEKTEIMQEVIAAYQAEDHLRLLELQMQLLESRENVFENFDNAQLKYFNQTLEKQVIELENELFFSSPQGNGSPYAQFYAPDRKVMVRNVDHCVKERNKIIKDTRHNIQIITDENVLLRFIRDYQFEDEIPGW